MANYFADNLTEVEKVQSIELADTLSTAIGNKKVSLKVAVLSIVILLADLAAHSKGTNALIVQEIVEAFIVAVKSKTRKSFSGILRG